MAGYLPLDEAAEYVTNKTGVQVNPDVLLRAGVQGVLALVVPFDSCMRNLTTHTNEEYLGLLVIPPRYLLKIETEGQAIIEGAASLDGMTMYAPHVSRTRDQLRVLVSELDSFIPSLVSIPAKQGVAKTKPENQSSKSGRPKEIDKKSKIVRRLIEGMTAGTTITPGKLPGSAADLLDACLRIEKAKTGKGHLFSITEDRFKTWLKGAGYGFNNGRPPNDEAAYWTRLCPKTLGQIPDDVFT